jgi:hypothetical protein
METIEDKGIARGESNGCLRSEGKGGRWKTLTVSGAHWIIRAGIPDQLYA